MEYRPKRPRIYKVGDKVKINKQIERGGQYYNSVTRRYTVATYDNVRHEGEQGIIARVHNGGEYYDVKFGPCTSDHYWTETMFEAAIKRFNSRLEENN